MDASKHLKRRFVSAAAALLIALAAMITATFAWYIYQTSIHTVDVRMAVGAGASLQISNSYEGTYGSSTVMDDFVGTLDPVSTDRITGGFQKVYGFTNGSENQPNLVANLFGVSESNDYYKTTLFIRTNGNKQKVYLSNIGYEDSDPEKPLSTALRVGLVTHKSGKNGAVEEEFIFAINTEDNPEAEYNTATGEEGYVLDSTKTDGTTVPLKNLYTDANYCTYDADTGVASLKEDSVSLFEVAGKGQSDYGEPVQVDVYVWLEGCDKDCTNNLCNAMLKNLALSFAGTEQ